MNQILPLISVLSMFTVIPAIYGAYIKLSARLLRYDRITWKQSYLFGLVVVICSSLMRAATLGLGHSLSFIPAIVLGLLFNMLIGGWFFGRRGANNEEGPLGWGRAMKLTGLALSMLCLTGAILIVVPNMITQRILS